MYYPSSENKGADQLRGYREADLCLCFRLCRLLVFPWGGSYIYIDIHLTYTMSIIRYRTSSACVLSNRVPLRIRMLTARHDSAVFALTCLPKSLLCSYFSTTIYIEDLNEYPQPMFWSKNKKYMYTPANPVFLYKSGV